MMDAAPSRANSCSHNDSPPFHPSSGRSAHVHRRTGDGIQISTFQLGTLTGFCYTLMYLSPHFQQQVSTRLPRPDVDGPGAAVARYIHYPRTTSIKPGSLSDSRITILPARPSTKQQMPTAAPIPAPTTFSVRTLQRQISPYLTPFSSPFPALRLPFFNLAQTIPPGRASKFLQRRWPSLRTTELGLCPTGSQYITLASEPYHTHILHIRRSRGGSEYPRAATSACATCTQSTTSSVHKA
ncbi:hypothetical protein C8Q80DRAFT_892283 [Daedaleopsis nitida]|nr:hypothetical protein C8Q80DRAFT_892283 [Daedaleopsis nitida]